MYKLAVISGPSRGSSYVLENGQTSIGRQNDNSIILPSANVSKKHCSIAVNGSEILIKDLGSSNGTFVNGALTKVKKLKPGDRISVGEFVFQVLEANLRASGAPPVVGLGVPAVPGMPGMPSPGSVGLGGDLLAPSPNEMPKDLKGRVIWIFENQIMKFFYELHKKYEWRMIGIALFVVFGVANLAISVYPLLEENRVSLVRESARRAQFIARDIAEKNTPFLAAQTETKAQIGTAENAEGVKVALITDLENRIIAPTTKLNQYLTSGPEARIAINARNAFRGGKENGFWIETDELSVVAVEPIKVLSPSAGRNVVVAMAIVSIDTDLITPSFGEMGVVYSEVLILTGIIGALIMLIFYRITLHPFNLLNDDLDRALKGEVAQISKEFKWEELNPIWEIINNTVQRIPKTQGGGFGAAELIVSAEEYVGPMRMFGNMSSFGLIVFDSEKKILYLNTLFEEISGIRNENAVGRDMSEVARDQAMGAFTSDVLSRVSPGGEAIEEDFEISGVVYKMAAHVFGTQGGVARCYVMTAKKGGE